MFLGFRASRVWGLGFLRFGGLGLWAVRRCRVLGLKALVCSGLRGSYRVLTGLKG